MKTCTKCQETKLTNEFYKRGNGLRAQCKRCLLLGNYARRKKMGYAYHTKAHDRQRFHGLREQVLTRDEYKCTACSMTQAQHKERWGRSLTIDHVDGQGRYAKEMNNTLENLRTLCLSDHGKENNRWNTPPRIYKANR